MTTAERPWSALVRLDDVPETGRRIDLEADDATRAALAVPAGVDAVERLTATFDLVRRGRDGLNVRGTVRGQVRQTCVVTLEPVLNAIDEAVDVDFLPQQDGASQLPGTEIEIPEADEPEPLVGNSVDLGLLATEFLILAVDPHPRKEGVAFTSPAAADEPAGHPFAALAALKKGTVKE